MNPKDVMPAAKEFERLDGHVELGGDWSVDPASPWPGAAEDYAALLGIDVGQGRHRVVLTAADGLAREEYRLAITADGIAVDAGSRTAAYHGLNTLRQLRNGPLLPHVTLRDFPRLERRGIHLMLESLLQVDGDIARQLIETASRMKLNTILLEFGERFPYRDHPDFASPSAPTRPQIQALADTADRLGVEIMPLMQSFGHLRNLLKHDAYADIREEDEVRMQICPCNPRAFEVWTELAADILDAFPNGRYLHVGADETWELGACPECRPIVDEHGKGHLYATHMNRVVDWTCAQGRIPILWDDMVCAHPDALEKLDPRAELMYWDYWTASDPTPYITARYGRSIEDCQTYDRRWDAEWRHELDDVTANMLDGFCKGVDLEVALGAAFMERFGRYLGPEFPKRLRGFPYIEYYHDHGRRIMGAPTCAGNTTTWRGMPDFPRYGENIASFSQRCIDAGTAGLVTTAWYNWHPEVLHQGMLITGCSTW